jgi:copper chaperone CopZ
MAPPTRPDTNSAERDLVYVVAGMTCGHCEVAVTEEVTQVAGVTSVEADLERKLVRVRGTDVDEAAVVAAIDEAGYDAVAA